MEQDLITLPDDLRSPQVSGGGSCHLVFIFLYCILCTIVCLSFSFLAMALSVYFRFMSLTVPSGIFRPSFIAFGVSQGSELKAVL